MKLKRWLCLIVLPLALMVSTLVITAEMDVERPDCTCYGAESISGHQEECDYRVFFRTLYKEKSADELARLWTQLTSDEQNYILNDVSWNVDQDKRVRLIECLNGKEEAIPETTEVENVQPDETVPGETIPDETTPDETRPEENEPEELQSKVLSDETTGVQVEGKDLPAGITLKVTNLAKRQVPSKKQGPVFRYDITLYDENSKTWQPARNMLITIPVNADQGEKLAIIHTHENKTYLLDVVTVRADGTVQFVTDGFSEFAGFTVDFHYNDVDYSIDGMTSILLSELFEAMGIEEDASKASQVVFSDPSLVQVTKQDGDWLLTSLKAFDTDETLFITFTDGHSILIDVTDEVGGKEDDGDGGTTKRYYLLGSGPNWAYSSRGILVWYNNSSITNGAQDIDVTMTFPDGTKLSDTGENFFLNPTHVYLKLKSDGRYWFKLTGSNKVDITDPGDDYFSYYVAAKTKWGEARYINFAARDTFITSTPMCNVNVEPKTSKNEENRTVQIWLNGKLYDSKTVAFPVRDSNLHSHYQYTDDSKTNSTDIRVQFNAPSSYRFTGVTVNQSSKTYRLDFYDYTYTLNYNVNGGNGSIASTSVGPTAATSAAVQVTSAVPTRNGYRFLGWADSASAGSAQYTAGSSITLSAGGSSSNGSSYNTSKTLYAVWQSIPSVTIHHYLEGTTTKIADDTVVALPHNQSVTTSSYAKSITHYAYASSSPASFTVGTTAAANTAIIYYRVNTTYQITYNSGGGTAVSAQTKYYNSSITLSSTKPTKVGYTFQYWSGSDGNTYQPGGTYSGNAALTLTAKWSPISYNIICNLDGGRLPTSNPGTYTIESATITLNDPVRDGYEFKGWTGSNGTTPQKGVTIASGSTGNKTYTANWSEVTYVISYDLAGGALEVGNASNYTINSSTFTLNNPTKTGYLFAGWTGSNGTTPQTTVTVTNGSIGAKSYVANWDPISYTVRFAGNGATAGSTADQAFCYGVAQALNTNGFRREYTVTYEAEGGTLEERYVTAAATFNGWYYGADLCRDGATVSNLATQHQAVVTLTADWTLQQVALPSVTRHNYVFLGWYDASSGGSKVGDAGDIITPSADMTLYARWDVAFIDVTASVNADRGVATPATQTINYGENASVVFTANTGYLLDYIIVNGERIELDNLLTYTHAMSNLTEDQVLVAYAVPNAYTVTYDSAGGTVEHTTQTKLYGVDLSLQTVRPVREGYRFLYWLGNDGKQYEAGATYTENRELTLTAQWQVQYRYKLQFSDNTTDVVSSMPEDLELTDWQDGDAYSYSWQQVPQRAGYRFLGWSQNSHATEATVNNAYVLTGNAAATATVTLYAVWEENVAVFTYQLEGAGSLSLQTETVPVKTGSASGARLTLPDGYKLIGWFDAAGNNISTELHYKPMRNVEGLYENASFTARVVQKTDDLVITITNPKTPIIVTVHCPDGLDMTFVANSTITIPNMPEGKYAVTAEAWGSDYAASVTTINGSLREGTPAAFSVGLSEKTGWSVVSAWLRNFFGMNDRTR